MIYVDGRIELSPSTGGLSPGFLYVGRIVTLKKSAEKWPDYRTRGFVACCHEQYRPIPAVTSVFPPCLFLLLLKQCARITLHVYVNVYTM